MDVSNPGNTFDYTWYERDVFAGDSHDEWKLIMNGARTRVCDMDDECTETELSPVDAEIVLTPRNGSTLTLKNMHKSGELLCLVKTRERPYRAYAIRQRVFVNCACARAPKYMSHSFSRGIFVAHSAAHSRRASCAHHWRFGRARRGQV
jgi:hypothetical protein